MFWTQILLDQNLLYQHFFLVPNCIEPRYLWDQILLILFYIFGLFVMIQPRYNNKNNTIFMGVDSIEINLVSTCDLQLKKFCIVWSIQNIWI